MTTPVAPDRAHTLLDRVASRTRPVAPRRPAGRRAALAALLAAGALLALAGPASAHVTVNADDSTRSADDSILTFRVPNEEDNARTVKLEIKFPVAHPLASVKPATQPGWTVTTEAVTFNPPIKTDDGTITSGVGEVTYTADSPANGIAPGDFGAFQVLVGPLPDTATLAFPTLQTYSDGKVISWVEPVTDPNNPPANPAPLLALTAAAPDPGAATAATSAPSVSAAPASASSTPAVAAGDPTSYATTSDVSTSRTLAILGLIIGTLGLGVGGFAVTRSRRTTG